MNVEQHAERKLEIAGWPVHLTSYKIADIFYCHADNISPGANLSRTTGATREEAEEKALARVTEMLGKTQRHVV